MLELLLNLTAAQTEPVVPTAAFSAPKLLNREQLGFGSRLCYTIIFSSLIAFSVFPNPELRKYQVAVQASVALCFFALEEVVLYRFSGLTWYLIIPIFAVGIFLSLRKSFKPIVTAIGLQYPLALLLFCIFKMQSFFIGILIKAACGMSILYLCPMFPPIMDALTITTMNTFMLACITELWIFFPSLLTKGLTIYYGSLIFTGFLYSVLIILIFVGFLFVRLVLQFITFWITGKKPENEKPAEDAAV